MINEKDKLLVFESFRKDLELPKYQLPIAGDEESMSEEDAVGRHHTMMKTARWSGLTVTTNSGSIVIQSALMEGKLTWWQRLTRKRKTVPLVPVPTMTIPEFFKIVGDSVEDLTVVEERAKGYETALANAVKCGQKALAEELTKNLVALRAETHLVSIGQTKYLAEEKLVEFVKKCPKGLRLDWIENFTRVIPAEVQDRKVACDTRLIFDNYVVLHYDPEAKSYAQTQAEKKAEEAARRDPILFGVLEGRRRLYFIGDWVDTLCDLTLDQVAELIGANSISELT